MCIRDSSQVASVRLVRYGALVNYSKHIKMVGKETNGSLKRASETKNTKQAAAGMLPVSCVWRVGTSPTVSMHAVGSINSISCSTKSSDCFFS